MYNNILMSHVYTHTNAQLLPVDRLQHGRAGQLEQCWQELFMQVVACVAGGFRSWVSEKAGKAKKRAKVIECW